jgi:hypothetical protein
VSGENITDMGFEQLLDELRREWPVIKQAPLLFIFTLLTISGIVLVSIHHLYKANLDRKNDLIKTLQDRLANRTSLPASGATQVIAEPPQFVLQVDGGNIFIPDQMPGVTGIALDVVIVNSGSPSIARDWQLSVIPAEGAPKTAQITKIPKSLVARGQFNTANISESESLVDSTLARPLETGVPRMGKLLFYVALPKSEVLRSMLELSVKDVKGYPFLIRKDMKEWMNR